jgi:hypothetical protein
LDPANILVTSFLSGPSASLGDVSAFANAPGADSEIDADLLSNATSNVLLQATHDITFYTGVNNTNDGVSLTAQAGNNINVNSLIHFNGDITLAANHNGAGTASGSGRVSTEGVPTAGGRLTITDVDRLPEPEPVTVPASVPTEPVAVAFNSTLTVIMNQGTSGIAGPDDLPRMIASNSPKAPDDKSTTTPNNDSQASKNDSIKTSYCN